MKLPPASTKASNNLNDCSLFIAPIEPDHALPILIAPRAKGDTRTPALGERILYLPSSVLGCGALEKSVILSN